jgi:excisionase family DNA binding protein
VYTPRQKKADMSELPKTMTVPEAGAQYFGLSRAGSYAAAKNGDIPTIRVGRLLRVPVRAMERLLDQSCRDFATTESKKN